MSCQIKGFANLTDTHVIKQQLFGDAAAKFNHIPNDELPLQNCCTSLSPAGDVLAIAWDRKLAILASKWDSREEGEIKNKFHSIWTGEITKEQNEWITSVICLPLISLGKAGTRSNPDWTCIAVGFNTGFCRFYTETGALLLEEQIHNEQVLGIKCQSFSSPKHSGVAGFSEEIYVIYNTVICILQGFPLFSTLRACRNHLARVKANCDDLPPVTNLAYKKWGFRNQDISNDSEVIGSSPVNTFDHLMTASLCGGYNASYRSGAPRHNLVLATGKRPFIGFHYALEGSTVPILSDVAIAMASKIANAIGTAVPWFRGGTKTPVQNEKAKGSSNEPAEGMSCRFGLSDIMREGDCIVSSPNKMLSVVSDAMGRVTLVDNRHGVAIRMWKGYRDAQCGWIEVEEEKESVKHRLGCRSVRSSQLRTALFLVIYAPKKGVIDIWGIQHGAKITTFTASKHGRLLYINYGLLGMNDITGVRKNSPQYGCVFMDPVGGLKEITVPFHFALNSKNGRRARDIHLLRKLKTFMREQEFDDEKLINEVTKVCLDMKTSEIRIQVLDMLINNKHIIPDALLAASDCLLKKLEEHDTEDVEPAAKALLQISTQLKHLIEFYKYIRYRYDSPPEYDVIFGKETLDAKALSSVLLTSERETHRILKLSKMLTNLSQSTTKTESKVKFKDDGPMFCDFLSCFELGTPNSIGLQKNINMEKKCQMSQLLYQGWMYSNEAVEVWKNAAMESNIQPIVFMQLATIYWLQKQKGTALEIEMKRFTQLLHSICSLADIEEICVEYNEISPWWNSVRSMLTESSHAFNALTAALMCRAVAITFEKYKERICIKQAIEESNVNDKADQKNTDTLEKKEKCDAVECNSTPEDDVYGSASGWENVSKDTCQFTLLIGNLEDISVLSAVVSQQPPHDKTTTFYALPYEKPNISLELLFSKGKGAVSEIVAKWLSSAGLDPFHLIDQTDVEFEQLMESIDSLKMPESLDEASATQLSKQDQDKLLSISVELGNEATPNTTAQAFTLEQITLLKRHFPYSLTSSVLLSNLCWEFAMAWNKDITQLEALEAALNVLEQIPMKHVKHGVCCLLWTLHIKKRMEAAAKLINKVGKLPKERLCAQDLGLSDIQLTTFLQHCVTFIDSFLDTEIAELEESVITKIEELWEGHTAGPQPFVALALSQTPAWYELVVLHLQLAHVLHMIAHFNLKVSKPLNNLFDSVANSYFFQDITDKAVFTWYRDDKRDSQRKEFLCRVITASIDVIHQEENTTEENSLSVKEAFMWVSKCQTLASIWKISNDELRIHQVCQFYTNGFERLAEEVLTAVNDTEKLASKLLPIAGRRILAYLLKAPDFLEEVARMTPTLTAYLNRLNGPETIVTNCSNEDTVKLIQQILRYLPESHRDYRLAEMMRDAMSIYEDKS